MRSTPAVSLSEEALSKESRNWSIGWQKVYFNGPLPPRLRVSRFYRQNSKRMQASSERRCWPYTRLGRRRGTMNKSSPSAPTSSALDHLCINTIRFLSIDAIQKANSGHPGMPMGAASMAYVLWTRFLRHNPSNPTWFNRDRFVLSAGHGSMLLYSLLYLTGYDLPMEQIKQFRQWGSETPGHPERGLTPGVETTTGPLGQGFGNGVGMAMAEAFLAARYNRPGHKIIDHYTYGLVSDGDLMEGVAAEAASLAGHLRLGKLIYLYDDNHISLS